MKTLVRKEMRENVRLAALGLVVHTLLLVQQYRGYVAPPYDMSQPLADAGILWSTSWFCAVFGAVLGWLQVHNERRPDLWAFLIHRPMTRTEIFLGKVMAGLGLYALVVGLPLLGFILWARLPGHVAAPFELRMLRPVAAYVLTGVLYYFAGMLGDLRQARWYASRVLGVGVAIVVSLLVSEGPAFWPSLLLILIGAAILATAVWGGFQSDGHYRGQPVWGKAALTTALMVGCLVVAGVAAMLVSNFFPRNQPSGMTSYAMTTNGIIFKSNGRPGRSFEIVDLEGKPLLDEKTGKPIDVNAFNRRLAAATTVEVAQDGRPGRSTWIQRDVSLAIPWRATQDTLWYYWSRYGRLIGYDIATRRCIGSLGPQGFATDLFGRGDRFSDAATIGGARTLSSTDTAVLQLDLEKRATSTLFTTTADDPILAQQEIARGDYGWQYTMVITKRLVRLLTAEGKPVWQTPYEPARASSTVFWLFLLEPAGQFALWIAPAGRWDDEARANHPGHVMWIARNQGAFKSIDLPALPVPHYVPRLEERLSCFVMPPALLSALPAGDAGTWGTRIPRELLLISWASAVLLCLPVGLWLGRRYQFSIAAQAGWAVFHLLFGVPGLLAFLSVQEWPARGPCPNCKRLRLVDRPVCHRCGAPWSPPEKTGTEVFAPLVASS